LFSSFLSMLLATCLRFLSVDPSRLLLVFLSFFPGTPGVACVRSPSDNAGRLLLCVSSFLTPVLSKGLFFSPHCPSHDCTRIALADDLPGLSSSFLARVFPALSRFRALSPAPGRTSGLCARGLVFSVKGSFSSV